MLKQNYWKLLVTFTAVLVMPLLLLSSRGNSGYYALLLCALICLIVRPSGGISFVHLIRSHPYLYIGMASLCLAMISSDLSWGRFSGKSYDGPSRMLLFPVMTYLLLKLPADRLRWVEWGYVIAAIGGAVLIFMATKGGQTRGTEINGIPLNIFSNIALTLGILSVVAVRNEWKLLIVLKLLAGAAALYASYLSGTRGGWVALPVLTLLAFGAFVRDWSRKKYLLVSMLVVSVLALMLGFSSIGHQRITYIASDIQRYLSGEEMNTSLGTRFQLWKMSWQVFREHPIFGVGAGEFKTELLRYKAKSLIDPSIADAFLHSHNDVAFHMATLGLLGMLAMLATYICPAWFFSRYLRHDNPSVRTAAISGLIVVIGYFLFGLSDCFFFWNMSYTAYSFLTVMAVSQILRLTIVEEKIV